MEEKLLESRELGNGLTLNIYDRSRKLIGDRWRVSVVAAVAVPLTDAIVGLKAFAGASPEEVRELLGDPVVYEYRSERSFVDKEEKDETIERDKGSILSTSMNYLTHVDFPLRFVLKEYAEAVKRRQGRH